MKEAGKIKLLRGLSPKEIYSRVLFALIVLVTLVAATVCIVNALRWIDKPFPGFLLNKRMVVGGLGQYHWTGTEAGLKFPDKIVRANGRAISSSKDLEEVIAATGVGDVVVYSVERGGEAVEIAVETMRFSLADLLVIFGVLFFSGVVYLLIATVVFVMKPDTVLSWAFMLLCFFLSTYNIMSFDNVAAPYTFVRFIFFVTAFIPAAGVHLSLLFPERYKLVERYPYLQIVPYVISTLIIVPLEIFYPDPIFLKMYLLVFIYIAISAVALLASTFHAYFQRSSLIARQRAKVVLFGAALAFPIPAFALLLSFSGRTLAGVQIQNNFLAIPILFFPAAIAYAIAKHNLFDVDVFIKRAVGYVIMTGVVGLGYLSMQTILGTFVLTPILGEGAEKVFPIFFALFVVFLFNPLNRWVQGFVDTVFFRKRFDYKETITSISNTLTSILDLHEIVRQLIQTVREDMFIDKACVVLIEPQSEVCQTFFTDDKTDTVRDITEEACIRSDDPFIELFTEEKKLITRYDILEDPRYAAVKEDCMKRFDEMGAGIALPLIYQNDVKGVFTFGLKKSGHFYTREDIDLLETLANQGAVAIENAKFAEKMKKEAAIRTNLSRYLSPQIVDQVVHDDLTVELGGDRKEVTVLFSDIRGFTTISENRTPVELVSILNEYFTEMAEIIFRNRGSIDKYIGDAIVAVFGSLIPVENSADRAVQASVEMMERLPRLNEDWKKRFDFSMNIGIGIDTGNVFLGNIGSPQRMEFTVIGDTVNVAARFSDRAEPGQILVTKNTVNCLSGGIRYNELPASNFKGKSGKLEVFELRYRAHERSVETED